MKRVVVIALVLTTFLYGRVEAQSEAEMLQSARLQAEQLLSLLRSQQWEQAAERVYVSARLLTMLSLRSDEPSSAIIDRVEQHFRQLYESVPPGAIDSVRLCHQSAGRSRFVLVSYRHGDLDGFVLRYVGDQWLYTAEPC